MQHKRMRHVRKGIVLLSTLVVIVLLSLAAYHFSDLSVAEFKTSDLAYRQDQARAIADSGIHYAMAVLSNSTNLTNLNGTPYDQPTFFGSIAVPGDDKGITGKFTLIAPPDPSIANSNVNRIGVTDETGKINVNAFMMIDPTGQTLSNVLQNLGMTNMTSAIANSIVDWMDADDVALPGGAESSTYSGMNPPYACKNGPLDSLEELALVQGVTPQILYGNDRNRNGILDPGEDDGTGMLDQGLYGYLTTYSRELQVNPQGQPLVYINDTNLLNLSTNLGTVLDPDLAKFIVMYRQYGPYSASSSGNSSGVGGMPAVSPAPTGGGSKGPTGGGTGGAGGGGNTGGKSAGGKGQSGGNGGNGGAGGKGGTGNKGNGNSGGSGMAGTAGTGSQAPTVGVLGNFQLNVTASTASNSTISSMLQLVGTQVLVPGSGNNSAGTLYNCPMTNAGTAASYLPTLYLNATTYQGTERPARININTAPPAVLNALFTAVGPNILTQQQIQNIISQRPPLSTTDAPSAIFQTPAWLYTQANVPLSTMQTLEQYVTTTSQVYRVQSVGELDGPGPSARVEAVIDTNAGTPRILSWRDLSELGRGKGK